MPARRNYYLLKPLIPWKIRMGIRRWRAQRNLEARSSQWPIKEGTQVPPDGWPGWPEGKRFALVLTHDVESQIGYDRCPDLMALEKEMGFRSSFNLIPQGAYELKEELRRKLVEDGFELGVHDLYHDGKLYWSREVFRHHARKINRYLKDWGATGFRSGFMLHELDWIHDLHIRYDASTFDTDPFEPQPDGMDTIFPFWVEPPGAVNGSKDKRGALPEPDRGGAHGSSGGGYVELPYTLPQDSTLFILLREESIDIWKRKIDWIARHGGMALLNVHPDYMNFSRETDLARSEYRARHYRDFLGYVQDKYGGQYWNALPRDVAEYCGPMRLRKPSVRRKLRVCMLAYTYYETDNRVMRYAETLARRGDEVEVVALHPVGEPSGPKDVRGVKVWRLQERFRRQISMTSYLVPILKFFWKAGFHLTRRHWRHRYDLIHVHNIPDFLVFAVTWPRLFGAKVILDIHDVVPELFCAKFQKPSQSWRFRILKFVEWISCAFSHHVIVSNHLWKKKLIRRSVPANKCTALVNHVDPSVFFPHQRKRRDDRLVALFPGTLQWHQGIDIAIHAFAKVVKRLPRAEFHIHGGGGVMEELQELAKELGLESVVQFHGLVPIEQMPQIIVDADLGIVPKRTDSFGNEAYSTKIMEFMSQGVPVVVSRTAIDQYYFTDKEVRFFTSGNVDELAEAIVEMFTNEELRAAMSRHALAYVAQNNWNVKKETYLQLVDALVENCPPPRDSEEGRLGQAREESASRDPSPLPAPVSP